MNEKLVVSREMAEKLKEAGFPQDTEYFWVKQDPKMCYDVSMFKGMGVKLPEPKFELIEKRFVPPKEYIIDKVSAPLTDELLAWLPVRIEEDDMTYELEIYKTASKSYMVIYPELYTKTFLGCFEARKDTLPDALAEMYLYLGKEGLLK